MLTNYSAPRKTIVTICIVGAIGIALTVIGVWEYSNVKARERLVSRIDGLKDMGAAQLRVELDGIRKDMLTLSDPDDYAILVIEELGHHHSDYLVEELCYYYDREFDRVLTYLDTIEFRTANASKRSLREVLIHLNIGPGKAESWWASERVRWRITANAGPRIEYSPR